MGKQYELKLFLKLSQNGHKSCYCPVDILEMGTVGREAGKTYVFFYLRSFQTLNLTKIKIKIVYLTINFFLLKMKRAPAITKYA
jgi:hypothetical protein